MAFPFLFLALSLSLGIWVSDRTTLPLAPSAMGLMAALVFAWIFYALKKHRASFLAVLIATVFLGSGTFAHFNGRYEQNALHRLGETSYADFTGVLSRSPSPGLERDYLYLRVEKIAFENKEERVSGNLRVSVAHSTEFPARLDYSTGDHLKVSAQIIPPQEYKNFKEPFSRMYLKTQLLHNLAATKSPLLIERIKSGRKTSILRIMSVLRQKCQRMIERNFASSQNPNELTPEGAVLETLILGGRGRLTPDTTQALQKTGLFHLFAISGAHIGMISFMIFGLLRFLRVPTRVSYILLIFLLVFYSLLVEGRASVLRAAIMSIAFLLGKLFWKDTHLINTISLSAFVILLFNPFQLFDLGFQLTFAATLAIILFYPKIMPSMPNLPLKISETFALSLTAQMGVLPLIAASFNRIIFSGLLLNLIGIPLVGLIMAAGYLFLPIAFISQAMARPAAAVISFLIKAFMWSTHLLDRFACMSYRIPTPSALVMAGYFLFLLLLLLPGRLRKFRLAALSAFLVFFALLILYPFSAASKDLKVTFIDVGQGDSILIEFPGRKKMLVDGGGLPSGTFDIGESVVSPFLWNKGIKRIDYLVLTHAHPDHLNGLASVARNFRIGEFWETASPPEDAKYAELKKSLGSRFQRRVFRGFWQRERDVRVGVLFPQNTSPSVSPVDNDRSLVLKIAFGSTAFLLPSDIGVNAEREILAGGDDIRSGVFKSPHHGSSSSSSDAFLAAVRPEVIVISVGRGNRFGFPQQEILDRYKETGARVYRTDLHGAVEIVSDGKRLSVRTAVRD
jgi:competence protein ComEC